MATRRSHRSPAAATPAAATSPEVAAAPSTTRERILAAAEACFVEEGYAAGTRGIATRAGVTQPLLLHHFGSKDGLFDAVIERALGRLITRQAAAFADDRDDLDFVLEGLHTLIHATLDDPALLRLITWARLSGRSPFTRGAAAYWQQLVARFEAAQRSGILRTDLDASSLVIVLDAAVKGFGERLPGYASVGARLGGASSPRIVLPEALFAVLLQGVLTPAALRTARRRLARRRPRPPAPDG